MSITWVHSKLENLQQHSDGKITARCPACAEKGKDKKGEHFAIFSGGEFACVAHPGSAGKAHRARILKLAEASGAATRTNDAPRGPTPVKIRRAGGNVTSPVAVKLDWLLEPEPEPPPGIV